MKLRKEGRYFIYDDDVSKIRMVQNLTAGYYLTEKHEKILVLPNTHPKWLYINLETLGEGYKRLKYFIRSLTSIEIKDFINGDIVKLLKRNVTGQVFEVTEVYICEDIKFKKIKKDYIVLNMPKIVTSEGWYNHVDLGRVYIEQNSGGDLVYNNIFVDSYGFHGPTQIVTCYLGEK